MPPTINEVIERLGLSDEQRAVVTGLANENARLRTNLGETTKAAREDRVKQRVVELQGLKFPPGFCKAYEEIALGDDGQPAATLNLSENGQPTGEKAYTATELAERLITALPYDDSGALALAARGGLGTITSPLSTRAPLTVADQAAQEKDDAEKGKKTPSAEAWLLQSYLAAPEMGPQLAEQFGVKLEDLKKAAEAHVNLAQGA